MAPRWAGRWARFGALLTRRSVLVTLAVLAVLFLVYTLAGFFLVPRLIATYVPRYAQERLGRRAEIGEIRVNPLLFKVDIRQFRLQEADGRPLLGFDRLFVDFELTSVFRAAWTFAEIRLEAPRVDAVIAPDGRLNIAELLDALPKSEPAPEPAAPPKVLLPRGGARRPRVVHGSRARRAADRRATADQYRASQRDDATRPPRSVRGLGDAGGRRGRELGRPGVARAGGVHRAARPPRLPAGHRMAFRAGEHRRRRADRSARCEPALSVRVPGRRDVADGGGGRGGGHGPHTEGARQQGAAAGPGQDGCDRGAGRRDRARADRAGGLREPRSGRGDAGAGWDRELRSEERR